MNQAEYRRKTHPEYYRRSWPLTILCALLAAFVIAGIFAAWRYLVHDSYLIIAVILPASFVALFLIIAALNGRKHTITGILSELVQLVYFWQ